MTAAAAAAVRRTHNGMTLCVVSATLSVSARSLEAMAYLFPEAIGGFGLEVGQTVVYILQPIFPTGCMRLLFHRDAAFAVL